MSLQFRLVILMAAMLITAGLFAAALWACVTFLPVLLAFVKTRHGTMIISMICSLSGAFTAIMLPLAAARHRGQGAKDDHTRLWPSYTAKNQRR